MGTRHAPKKKEKGIMIVDEGKMWENENGLHIYTRKSNYNRSLEILFVDRRGDKDFIAKPVELVFTELKEDEFSEPTLRLNNRHADKFMIAMAKMLNDNNIKLPDEHKIHGLYEATVRHLEDLRKLLKLNKKEAEKE